MAGKDEIGLDVGGLDKVGGTIRGRTENAKASGKLVTDGIFGAGEKLGVGKLVTAAKSYAENHLQPHSSKLPGLLTDAGTGVSNTARTGRAADEEGGRRVNGTTDQQLPLVRPINGANKVV